MGIKTYFVSAGNDEAPRCRRIFNCNEVENIRLGHEPIYFWLKNFNKVCTCRIILEGGVISLCFNTLVIKLIGETYFYCASVAISQPILAQKKNELIELTEKQLKILQ